MTERRDVAIFSASACSTRCGAPLLATSLRETCNDVAKALAGSPFIHGLGISVTIDSSGVTLDGTTNNLIAIPLASTVPRAGYGRVQLRVQPSPRADD